MAIGKIKDIYPPGNNGARAGAGKIVEDITGKSYVFQTPADISPDLVPISVGMAVQFEVNGNQVGNITKPVAAAPVSCTLTASPPDQVTQNSFLTLSWTSQNATSLSLDNGIGPVSPLAAGSMRILQSTLGSFTYKLTATNDGGKAEASVTVLVTAGATA